MVSELTVLLDKMDRVCQCTPSVLANFVTAVLEFVADFFVEFQRMQRHIPESSSNYGLSALIAGDSTPVPSNVCFSMVLSASNQRERNAMMNDRWRVFNNGTTSKPTKNITVVKRADLLENAVRDGEVNTNDQFVSVIYSFLRFSVRYVSQYRPQVLKALLNEQPKALNLAIDTLFLFVSSTNQVDDITIENFKIVTLADAVVHLLLVISETTMEDPELCRQFIRLVIGVLRSRVNSAPDADTSSPLMAATEPEEAETTLMDLPMPVLMLMKSLLRGVSRCQIFVEEGGHTFVAEQLQLALDSCAQDWPAHTTFPDMSRQLNALASHITGAEPSNPLLNSTPPAPLQPLQTSSTSSQPPPSSRYNSTGQLMGVPSSSIYGSSTYTSTSAATQSTSTTPPPFALTCPSVTLQPSSSQPANHPFLAHMMPGAHVRMSVQLKPAGRVGGGGDAASEIFNFAPVATFRSELITPSHLAALNNVQPDGPKRTRNATFSYKFSPKKQWVDVVMVLPYKIVLYEVIVQIPESSQTNAPTSIQVEVTSDPAQANWTILSAPVISENPCLFRISTHSYRFPVTGVRLNFQCPKSTNLMHLGQIQLLGATSVRAMRFLGNSKMFESQLMNQWVTLFARLCSRIDLPSWKCAPTLAESLIKVYLGEENSTEMSRTIYDLLLQLDRKSKASNASLVHVVVNYLVNGGRICPRAYLSLAELLYAACALPTASSSYQQRFGLDNRPVHLAHATAVSRQRQLLHGIQRLLTNLLPQTNLAAEDSNWARPEVLKEIAVFVWSAACVIWHNTSEESIRYDTIAICLEVGPVIIPYLARFVLNVREPNLLRASSWMLCTLGRTSPQHLELIFENLGLNQTPAPDYSTTVMNALGKICQSATAVRFLISRNLLNDWAASAVDICSKDEHHRLPQLLSIVDCFNQLAVVDVVAEHFDSNEGGRLFHELLNYIRKHCAASSRQLETLTNASPSVRFVDATISLIRRCLAYGGGHRDRVARMVSEVLKSTYTTNQKGVTLPETFEDIVLRLIVADETITVRLTGVVNKRPDPSHAIEDRMLHPLFGCNQDDRIMDIPLSTVCHELLPYKQKPSMPSSLRQRTMDDFMLGNQLKLGTLFAADEVEDKEAAPPPENRPPLTDAPPAAPEYPYTFKQFAIQLICGAYSTSRALNNKWSLAKVIDGLRAIRRFNHRQTDGVSLIERVLRDEEEEQAMSAGDEAMEVEVADEPRADSPRPMISPDHPISSGRPIDQPWQSPSCTPHCHSRTSSTVDPKTTTNEGDFTDGYFTLTLRVKASLQTNVLSAVEDESMLSEFLQNIPPSSSTLSYFARCGGLKLLAQSVDLLSRVDGKLQSLTGLMTQLSEAQYGMIKREITNARRALGKVPLKSGRVAANAPGTSQSIQNAYRSLYQAMEEPVLKVYNVFQMLQARGIQLESNEGASSAGGSSTQTPKPPTANAAFAALQYEPAIFDGMVDVEEEELLSMVDFMHSNEVFTSPMPNKPLKSSSEAYSYALSMVDEWDAGPSSAYAPSAFTTANNAPIYLPPPSTLLQMSNETAKSEIFGQLSNQLAEFASKVQGMQSSLQNDSGSYVFKLPVSIPLKRFAAHRSSASSASADGSLEYILVALSLFLEIDTYGETLVEFDKNCAKRLIYLLLGMDPPAISKQRLVDGLHPLLPQSLLGGTSGDSYPTVNDEREEIGRSLAGRIIDRLAPIDGANRNENEMERLMLVPFLALSRCFENANPTRMTTENAERIRLEALENGSMDVILTLLSHYGHQKAAKTPIRASGDLVVVQLISRLIAFASDVQSIVVLFNATGKSNQRRPSSTSGATPSGVNQGSQSTAGHFGGFTSVSGGFGSQTGGSGMNDGQFWAKGTGFGSGNTATQWNLAGHVAKRKQHEVTVTCLLNILSNFIKRQPIAATGRLVQNLEADSKTEAKDSGKTHQKLRKSSPVSLQNEPSPFSAIPAEFVNTLQRSCLNATLNSYMMNDSVLDISRHVVVYESVVGLILSICSSAPIAQTAGETPAMDHMSDLILETDTSSGCSVYDRLKKLCGCVEIYMTKLNKTADSAGHQEENLGDLLEVAQQAMAVMTERDKIRRDRYRERFDQIENEERMEEQRRRAVVPDENGFVTGQPLEIVYNEVMKSLQFDSMAFFGPDGVTPLFPYLYSSNLASSSSGVAAKRTRRLAQEIVTLSTSLPLSLSSSVFLRTADERLDVMKVLITGPSETPYSGGCFEFDVSFPENYPLTPMNMNLQTTGNRTVRFNPNLYEEGKVCLSVLNTWSGRPEERWNAETSSFLQVLVSIQSLIFVNEPYFNEPGFERSRGTPAGDQSSRDYTANIRHQCIRWAMLEMLRKPPAAFVDVIRRHFWLKRDEICLQIQGWIRETREFVEKNAMVKSMPQHLTLMEKNFENLLNEFHKMECPSPDLAHVESKFVVEHFAHRQQR